MSHCEPAEGGRGNLSSRSGRAWRGGWYDPSARVPPSLMPSNRLSEAIPLGKCRGRSAMPLRGN